MSAILKSDDLNDFISPGAACIKPVEVHKTQDNAEIEIGSGGEAYEVSVDGHTKQQLDAAQISLSDCLACSGCITSAESVLVAMQSHTEVLDHLANHPDKVFIASVSHQVRVSLATAFGLSIEQADSKLAGLFQQMGFTHVVGLETGRAIALEYGAREVMESASRPILSSSCPGWTCYVEKTHPHMIPYLSQVKSPQQITGSLVKQLASRQYSVSPGQIYHVSVMPCFDKKLEAARPEFAAESEGEDDTRDVDCVITTKEIVQMLQDQNKDFASLPESALFNKQPLHGWPHHLDWSSNGGTTSGGYLEHVMGAIRQQHHDETRVDRLPGRNADIVEYHIYDNSSGALVGKAAQIYGFRNIQNLVRKLKRKNHKVDWDYVEVMACPGGCVNGGGQIGRPQGVSSRGWIDAMESNYRQIEPQLQVSSALVNDMLAAVDPESQLSVGTRFQPVQDDPAIPKALSVGTTW